MSGETERDRGHARMSGGQEIDVIVTARTRTEDGQQRFECEAIMPVRYRHRDGRAEENGAPTVISVSAEHLMPIPGENYGAVPTTGRRLDGSGY